jgi:hypothetical protein
MNRAGFAVLASLVAAAVAVGEEVDVDALRALGYVDEASDLPATARLGVLRNDRRRARGGIDYVTVGPTCSSHIARPDGEILRRWSHAPCHRWSNSVLTPSGEVVVAHTYPVPPGATPETVLNDTASLLKLDWEGHLLWENKLAVHHDVGFTPDGNIAALTRRLKVFPQVDPTIPVRDHGIAILSPAGVLLEEASLMEIMARSRESYEPIAFEMIGRSATRAINALHANSIDWMTRGMLAEKNEFYSKENVLVSLRVQNAIVLIHWPSKKIVWSWGHGELLGPHDAHVLPTGNILLFDNGSKERRSRIVELDPLEEKIVWEYKGHDFFSLSRSSAQRLPNGNTLVAVSNSATAFEVTPQGELVWEFRNPEKGPKGDPAVIVRIRNYDPGADLRPTVLSD